MSFMNMPLLTCVDEISPRPVLLIAGENAHSRYFSEDAYEAAAEPKELMIIENADHVDLYDRTDEIPLERIAAFFGKHLGRAVGGGSTAPHVRATTPSEKPVESPPQSVRR
jgi:fermentation-respiration switch protein FrsA (DUF1100 family)